MISGAVEYPYDAVLLYYEQPAIAAVGNIEGTCKPGCPVGEGQGRLRLYAEWYQQGDNGAVSGHVKMFTANVQVKYLFAADGVSDPPERVPGIVGGQCCNSVEYFGS